MIHGLCWVYTVAYRKYMQASVFLRCSPAVECFIHFYKFTMLHLWLDHIVISTCPVIDIWVVSISWQSWILMLSRFICNVLYGQMFEFLRIVLSTLQECCLTFWGVTNFFSKMARLLHILIYNEYNSGYSTAKSVMVVVKWYLIVGFICIFILTNYVYHLFIINFYTYFTLFGEIYLYPWAF
jgi:hypothetical protein